MARQRFGILIAAMSCVATVAFCGEAAGAVKLALKLDKGKTYYERSLVDQRITQSVMGQEQVINVVIGVGQKLDVLEVDGQGNMRVRYTYNWVRIKQGGPMGNVDYDSSQQGAATAGAEGFAALIGQAYTVKLTPQGKVLDVNGVEEMVAAVGKKAPGVDASAPDNPLSFLVSRQAIQENTEGSLAVYPDEPVEEGASWSRKRTTRHGFAAIMESKWTLQKRQGGVATIASTAKIAPDPAAPPMDAQGMKMKFDLSGTQEGTMQMDEATGLLRTIRATQDLKGQIKIGASAEGPFDMAIPMVFHTTVTAEMNDRMWEAPLKQP